MSRGPQEDTECLKTKKETLRQRGSTVHRNSNAPRAARGGTNRRHHWQAEREYLDQFFITSSLYQQYQFIIRISMPIKQGKSPARGNSLWILYIPARIKTS